MSEILGQPFIVTCNALTQKQISHINESSSTSYEKDRNIILEATKIEGKKLSDEVFRNKFGVYSNLEVVDKLFLAGEAQRIINEILELSGYLSDAVVEIKN